MLPVLDARVIESIKLPYLKQTIKIKPYKSVQEKALLNCLTDRSDKQKWADNMLNIIKENLVEGDIDLHNIKVIDFLYIAMKLRAVSKNDKFEYIYNCVGKIKDEPCKYVFKESVPLDELLKVKNSSNEQISVKVNDLIALTLEPPTVEYLKYLSTIEGNEDNNPEKIETATKDIFDILIAKIAYSTKEIIITENNKPKTYKDFNKQELIDNILLNLTMDELKNILEEMNKLISISFVIKRKCPECGEEYKEENTDFFTLLA